MGLSQQHSGEEKKVNMVSILGRLSSETGGSKIAKHTLLGNFVFSGHLYFLSMGHHEMDTVIYFQG